MLNIFPQRSAAKAKDYFAKSDYYMSDTQELNGHWGGKGAQLLGLSGEVDKSLFDMLCDNLDPNTGKPLTRITREDRRVGYDFTFSAPKSISLVHAFTGDERIMTAFRESIRETMADLENDMQARVRKNKQDADRTTENLVYAEFIHLTGRPVDGVPDPQLHAHLFTFNTTFDPVENQWKAAQFGAIKASSYYWQAVQQARFANRLQELGYAVHGTKHAFEITSIPAATLDKFSLRTKVIESKAKELGITDPRIKAMLAASTREAKDDSYLYRELKEIWDKRLTTDEREAFVDLAHNPSRCDVRRNETEHVKFAVDHVFQRASVVDERRLMAAAIRHGIGEVTPEGIAAEVNKLGLLRRETSGKVEVTTEEILKEEWRMLAFATRTKGSVRPLVGTEAIKFTDRDLDVQQRAAVELPLRSADRMTIIRGKAGTGKSKSVAELVKQIRERRKGVALVAPTVKAVNVLKKDGFDETATLAKLLIDPGMQVGVRDGYIVLDEAGMVDMKSMNALFDLAKAENARIVLLGDKGQLAAVNRGSPLRLLEELAGLKVAELTTIRRQSGEYREVVKLLAQGDSVEAVGMLDKLEWIKLTPEVHPYQPLAQDYVEKIAAAITHGRDPDEEAIIVSPTHAESAKVTDAVRLELRMAGLIGEKERLFERLVPTQWTDAQMRDPAAYNGAEILQFHHNSGAFKAGERVAAKSLGNNIATLNAEHFAVFEPGKIALAAGDVIRTTAKGKTLDRKHTVGNGSIYRVEGFNKQGNIVLSNGWVLSKSFGHLANGYVNTSHAAQGRTVKHVLVAQSGMSFPAGSRENFYVAASRGRLSLTIYTNDREQLREAVARSHPRLSAIELEKRPQRPLWQKARDRFVKIQLFRAIAAKRAMQQKEELVHAR